MIQKDLDALEKEKSNSTKKNNTFRILENINATFTGIYLHYGKLPKEAKLERRIPDRIKSKKERLDIIKKNKENINNELLKEYFDYSNPETMIKRLKDVGNEKNKNVVKLINKNLNKMKKSLKMCLKIKHLRLERMKK